MNCVWFLVSLRSDFTYLRFVLTRSPTPLDDWLISCSIR